MAQPLCPVHAHILRTFCYVYKYRDELEINHFIFISTLTPSHSLVVVGSCCVFLDYFLFSGYPISTHLHLVHWQTPRKKQDQWGPYFILQLRYRWKWSRLTCCHKYVIRLPHAWHWSERNTSFSNHKNVLRGCFLLYSLCSVDVTYIYQLCICAMQASCD